jgi:uncharacterized coiled-coil protein SlyX
MADTIKEYERKLNALKDEHAIFTDRKQKEHEAEHRAKDNAQNALLTQHQADREGHRVKMTELEADHLKAVNNRDAILAGREADYQKDRASFAAMHALQQKETKDKTDALLADKHKELRDAESKYNAAILALRDEMSRNLQAHAADLDKANADHHARIEALLAEKEAMRKNMQAQIDELRAQLEAQRAEYEAKINGLNSFIGELKIKIQMLEAQISTLQIKLGNNDDLIAQLNRALADRDAMFKAKEALQI